jgi:hypothetical protein
MTTESKKIFHGKITIDAASLHHLEAMKRIDQDSSIPSWSEKMWDEVWNKKALLGVVAWQLNEHNRRHIVGFALLDRSRHDREDLLKLVVHDDADFNEVGTVMLRQFKGKIVAWVRERNVKLCNLLKYNKFKFIKREINTYSNPVDDGYKFEGIIIEENDDTRV